jgi:hypothetical protein
MKFNKQTDIEVFEKELSQVIEREENKKDRIDLYVAYCSKWIYCSKCQGTGIISKKQKIFFRKEEACSECGGYGINENGFRNISIPSFEIWSETAIKETKPEKEKKQSVIKKEERKKVISGLKESNLPKGKKAVKIKEKGE